MTAGQLTAFQANSGFSASDASVVLVSSVFVVLLVWGVWALRTAYVGWAEDHISQRRFLGVAVRFVAMYIVLTFFLVSAVYQAAVFGKLNNLEALAIGLTLAGAIFAGGVYSGGSLNPARTLGPALVAGNLNYVVPYMVGQFLAGALGGLLHMALYRPEPETAKP